MNTLVLASVGLDAAIILMGVTWLIARRLNNAGIVEAAWAYGFTPVVALFALAGGGALFRKTLILGMVACWSLRLGTHLLLRVKERWPREDSRYEELRTQFPKRPWFMFFGFFQLQAFLIGLLAVPFAFICSNGAEYAHPLELAAMGLWVFGFSGEWIADRQLKTFRQHPENKGRTCASGLWRYSRHPNYFCEWLMWISYWLFAMASPGGWVTVYCPMLMFLLLRYVTGVPANEAHTVKSRPEDYRRYQKRTAAFFPGMPREAKVP